MSLLTLENLNVFYGDLQAIFGISLRVEQGETIAVIGANGAGKSTLMRAIIGLTPVRSGHVRLNDEDVSRLACDRRARRGISLVPEGRRLFGSLTVEENLLLARAKARSGPWDLEAVYGLFPPMTEFRGQMASDLSGGQQQMVAISRALLTNPSLLLCDELSLGLAPKVIGDIYACFDAIRSHGVSIIVVEQDVVRARASSSRLYCLLKGRITLEGTSSTIGLDEIRHAYFGEQNA